MVTGLRDVTAHAGTDGENLRDRSGKLDSTAIKGESSSPSVSGSPHSHQ